MKNISKKKSSMINIFTMAVYQLVAVIMGFIIPKLLLETYGADIHGYTSTVTTIMSYVALLNAGLSVAGIQALYKPLAENDEKKINSVINAVGKFYTKTGIMYTIAIISIACILPSIINGNVPTINIILLMLIMGGTNTLECFLYSKSMVLLQASQRLYIVNLTNTLSLIMRSIIQIILIKLNFSILFIQLVPVIMVLFRMFILKLYIKKKYTYIDKNIKPDDLALSKRWSAFSHQIAGLVVNNTDVVLLTIFTDLVNVSIYSVYNLVFSHLYSLMTSIFSHGTVASFGVSLNEGNMEKTRKAFDLYEFIYYFVVSVVYSITACMILPFIGIYTENMTDIKYIDVKLAILFVIISILNNLRVPCNTIINAAGHFKETKWRAVTEALINIILSLCLVVPFGMHGLLIGTICSFLYRSTDIIIYANKHILNRNILCSLKRVIKVIMIIILNIVLFNLIYSNTIIDTWIKWLIAASVIGLISLITTGLSNYLFERKNFDEVFTKYIEKLTSKIIKKK